MSREGVDAVFSYVVRGERPPADSAQISRFRTPLRSEATTPGSDDLTEPSEPYPDAVASILVVCSGNLCRSPFAEGILRRMLTERFGASAPEVSSVGTIARDGDPATNEAIAVAAEHGIDTSSHAARRLAREGLAESDLVLAMAAEHRDAVVRLDPDAATKTFTVKELVRLLEDLPDRPDAGGPESLAERVAEARCAPTGGVRRQPGRRGCRRSVGTLTRDVPGRGVGARRLFRAVGPWAVRRYSGRYFSACCG